MIRKRELQYEPAIQSERKQTIKVRSLFRTKPTDLSSVYFENGVINLKRADLVFYNANRVFARNRVKT
jgi:hypothetical protein